MNKLQIIKDYGPDSGGRIKGLTIVKPVVYGSIAQKLSTIRSNGHTHQWKVYLKSYVNEDMSAFIKKVQFRLHNTYADSVRTIVKPPYEVIETGWGEFEVTIKIFFHDTVERPLTIHHELKLLPAPVAEDENALLQAGYDTVEGLVSEQYDEIVFKEPTVLMNRLLSDVHPVTSGPYKHHTDFEAKKKESLDQILVARQKVNSEMTERKEKFKLIQKTNDMFKRKLAELPKSSDKSQ